MRLEDAAALITGARIAGGPAAWADLGSGDGTFTRALASLLPPGSVIHAMDQDASALRRIAKRHAEVTIVTHAGDFTALPWPFDGLDGVLLANALHYVPNQPAFLRAIAHALAPPRRVLIVEYDTDRGNPWVPYPVSRSRLEQLFDRAEGWSIDWLGSRPSRFQRAPFYAAMALQERSKQPSPIR